MTSEIIKLAKISKRFYENKKDIKVLSNIDLKINRGDLVSLSGPSGSGKSTLLHIMALLDQPTSGEVFFNNKNFSKSNDSEKDLVRSSDISIIYQHNNLLSDFTALENTMMPLLNNGYSSKEAEEKAKNTLSLVSLTNREDHFPSELSGGEQQRVAVARAIIAEPNLILADEPTGSLDMKTADDIFSLLLERSK